MPISEPVPAVSTTTGAALPTGTLGGGNTRAARWTLFLITLVGSGAYLVLGMSFALPEQALAWQRAVYLLVALAGTAAVLVGVRIHRPRATGPWLLIAAGLTLHIGHDLAQYLFRESLFGWQPDAPANSTVPVFVNSHKPTSATDLVYLAGLAAVVTGLLWMRRTRSAGRERGALLELGALVAAGALGFWVLIADSWLLAPGLPVTVRVLVTAYTAGLGLLWVSTLGLVTRQVARTPAFLLALTAAVCVSAGHILLTLPETPRGWQLGQPQELLWMGWYAAWGLAALHPTMRLLQEPGEPSRALGQRWRLVLLTAASLLPPVVLITEVLVRRQLDTPTLVVASMVVLLLVMLRVAVLAGELGQDARRQRGLLLRTLRAREAERARIAVELHDGPVQRLSSLVYSAELAARRSARGNLEGSQVLVEEIRDGLLTEVDALRRVMGELQSHTLERDGLPAALRSDAADFAQRHHGTTCTVETDLTERLHREVETVLYRIAQEALTNIAKHARATRVRIALDRDERTAVLSVIDDGTGFDIAAASARGGHDHFGLGGMRQRAETAGGTLDVTSEPGAGTIITALVPLNHARS